LWAVATLPPAFALAPWVRDALVLLLVAAGLAFDLAGLVAFRRLRTTVNPLRPQNASALVTGGILPRHAQPHVRGHGAAAHRVAVQLSSAWPFFGPLAFVLFIDRFQVVPEEKAMR
jgi:protein-S-isoprenylcysteine O-methyltransferase Ste14